MPYWEIMMIVRGYRKRNILMYQLQRMEVWASMFCMGNPKGKEPEDIVPLYFDKMDAEELPDDDEVEKMRREIQDENKRRAKMQ